MHLHNNPMLSIILLLVLMGTHLLAQEEAIFHSDANLVPLHTTVIDKDGNLVTNLPRSAFRVYEDDVEQAINVFRREDVPVSVGLVIDNSGTMREKRQKVEAAALKLVKASNPQDRVFIVNFDDTAYIDCEFTNDVAKLEEGLARMDQRGGTAMRDAISLSIDYMKKNGTLDKKVIFVVTDGEDNMSSVSLEKLVQEAQQSEVLIYTIGLLNEEDRGAARRARRAIDAITTASGGAAYYPKNLLEVDAITDRVAHEVRNQYIIAYTPSNSKLDGSYRRVRVRVSGPNRPTARTRTGYYAVTNPVAPKGSPKAGASN
jgi:VWFA-related protein